MICKTVTYGNYRNIESETLTFSDGINVLWGRNGQGKSNMLEGIYMFARGRSFRGAKEAELIRFDTDCAALDMICRRDKSEYDTALGITIPKSGRKRVTKNGAALSSVSELIGSYRAVLFCPAHLSMITGAPAMRRSFMDIAAAQLSPLYVKELAKYNRALAQRNAALKSAAAGMTVDRTLWETYAALLAESGAEISAVRGEYIAKLAPSAAEVLSDMTDGAERLGVRYVTQAGARSAQSDGTDAEEMGDATDRASAVARLTALLTDNIDREIRYGTTLYGIHKDDLVLRLNGRDAKTYASQGQQRSIVIALKLAEGDVSRRDGGENPVYLLDDVLSELDGERHEFVLESLVGRQIIVTSCEASTFAESVNLIPIEAGRVRRQTTQSQ